jgi:hypothetical protein
MADTVTLELSTYDKLRAEVAEATAAKYRKDQRLEEALVVADAYRAKHGRIPEDKLHASDCPTARWGGDCKCDVDRAVLVVPSAEADSARPADA